MLFENHNLSVLFSGLYIYLDRYPLLNAYDCPRLTESPLKVPFPIFDILNPPAFKAFIIGFYTAPALN